VNIEVRHSPQESRYEIWRDGERAGLADYRRHGNTLTFVHTEVDRKYRGEGLAEQLVQGALDDVRRRGETLRSECPFISKFLREHSEYQDLLAA
jgi:predicted GNAT family acetyltransferase